MKESKILKTLPWVVIVLALITSAVGLFQNSSGAPFYVENIYGQQVQMYGKGLYAFNTFFKAPIQRGTDFITLFVAIPLLCGLLLFYKKSAVKLKLLRSGLLVYFLYYSASLALSVAYNNLFLIYILLFSSTLFAFMLSLSAIDVQSISDKLLDKMPRRGIAVFMIFEGFSVFVWLIEILGALSTGRPPVSLGVYTTEPTYVFDLGIIAPSCFAGAALLFQKKPQGYAFASILLVLNFLIGLVVISQTVFQRMAGIEISLVAFIAFVGSFVTMSLIAIYLIVRLLKGLKD